MTNYWLNRSLSLWHIDDGECHWYSAYSKDDAVKQYVEGGLQDEELDDLWVEKVDDNKLLSVKLDSDFGLTKTMSAVGWAKQGRGFVASTLY